MIHDIKDYKIVGNGIWISKEELERLLKKYDNEYTKIFTQYTAFPPDENDIKQIEFVASQKSKYTTLYHFIKYNFLDHFNE